MRLFATSQRINVDRKFVFNYPKERLDAGALSVTVHLTKHDDDGCDTCFDLIIGCNMTLDVNVRFYECINRMFILLDFWQNKFLKSVAMRSPNLRNLNLLHAKAHQICRCDGAKKRRKDTIGLCSSIFVALAIYGFLCSSCKKCRMNY